MTNNKIETNSVPVNLEKLRSSYYKSEKCLFDSENYFFQWYRPISFYPTAILLKLGVSANLVTIIGASFLITALLSLSMGNLLSGAFLYLIAYLLDFVDGNIARFNKTTSHFGGFIDGLIDSSSFLLFIALGFGNVNASKSLFSASTDIFIGTSVSIIFLFRLYFQLRKTFVLKQMTLEKSASKTSNKNITQKNFFVQYVKVFLFALISGMPIFLLLAVATNFVTLYLILYLLIFSSVLTCEILYGIWIIWKRSS